jgi:hypothetical protein
MKAPDIVALIERHGARLSLDGSRIIARPASALTGELRHALRTHKVEVMAYLNKNTDSPATIADASGDSALEKRRQLVLSMLTKEPDTTYAITMDDKAEPDAVIVTLAIRNKLSCELWIEKSRYDGLALLELIEEQTHKQPHED